MNKQETRSRLLFEDEQIHTQLEETIELLKNTLSENLLGIYLYGSATTGGLEKFSDLDLFVVTENPLSSDKKKELVQHLLELSGEYKKSSERCLEVTIVTKSMISPWSYPPLFDFQYGEWLRDKFKAGNIEPWETKEMPDLALIITQLLLNNKNLYGPEPQELLPTIPYADFIQAMLSDLDRLSLDLEADTRNVLLTAARIWSTIATNSIQSKKAAADWVYAQLPELYQPVITRAKEICTGEVDEYWDDLIPLTRPCLDFMIRMINKEKLSIDFSDLSKKITLAQE